MHKTKAVEFYQRCLKCQHISETLNYTCTCGSEDWTKEYRILGVTCQLSPEEIQEARMAFWDYDVHHPQGILQYFLTPHQQYKEAIDFKVGGTSFIPLEKLSQYYGTQVFLKNEAGNPSGCFKDRETVMAALHSMAQHLKKAVIYSSGNAAASAALFANHLDFQLITCVAGDTYPEKIEYIRKKGSAVIRIGDQHTNFEEGYRLFAQLNNEGFFTQNGFDNWSVRNPYRVLGDKTTALEIIKQFSAKTGRPNAVPDFVIVSTGNGTCLAGIWNGFKELKKLGLIDRCPRMVSAAIKNASPVYKAFKKRMTSKPAICDLDEVPESDKEIGSTILAEEGYDSMEATKAVIESKGLAIEVSRRGIRRALIDLLKQEEAKALEHQLLPEPASLVTLAALKKMKKQKKVDQESSVVALISGHGAKAKDLLLKMLKFRPKLQKVMLQIIQERKSHQNNCAGLEKGELIEIDADLQELRAAIRKLNREFYAEDVFAV